MSLIINALTNHLQQQLTKFPFHNLNLLNDRNAVVGGTCFDHALTLKHSLEQDGYIAKLHEAEVCMTGQKTHRLVRVEVDGTNVYLDTGSGWPTNYVMGLDSSTQSYEIAGIKFKITPYGNYILVQRFNGRNWLDMNRISVEEQEERTILGKFDDRYNQNLPFNNELRLCWLDGRKFNRIAGDQLFTYEAGKGVVQISISPLEMLRCIEKTVFPELIPDLQIYVERSS